MRDQEASVEINKLINVTHTELALAKNFIIDYCRHNVNQQLQTSNVLNNFLKQHQLVEPKEIVYSSNEDTLIKLTEAAKYFTYYLAGIEAICSLIHQDILINEGIQSWRPSVQYKYHSYASGLHFDECYTLPHPSRVWLAPQYQKENSTLLTDPDQYILMIGIGEADEEIKDAVKDAILCFQKCLYRPSLNMLGKAIEGAWIEVGLSLAKTVYKADNLKQDKFVKDMQGIVPTNQKIRKVVDLYKNETLSGDIIKKSGIQPSEIDNIYVWSDILRDARNAIHFGVKPTFPNNYEKAATMLLGAAKNMPKLYYIKNTCDRDH